MENKTFYKFFLLRREIKLIENEINSYELTTCGHKVDYNNKILEIGLKNVELLM